MSLTSILKGKQPNEKEFQAIIRKILPKKGDFQTLSGKPALSKQDYDSLVPYALEKQDNSSVIGTAFDYMARVMVARVVKKNSKEATENLTAENGLRSLANFLRKYPTTYQEIEDRLDKAIHNIKRYSENDADINDIIVDACFLAKLERIYRSGMPPMNILEASFFDDPDEEVVRDLALLNEVFQEKFMPLIHPQSKVIYNPNFGVSSAFVRGADADIIIDGTLYDFKSTKQVGYVWQDVAQIVGYFFLNELTKDIYQRVNKVESKEYEHHKLNRLGFYRARYGEIEYVDTSFFSPALIEETKKQFASYFAFAADRNPIIEKYTFLLEAIVYS